MKKILVVGSLNMDIVLEVGRMPREGETISGKSIARIPGGKGANQACAAGKLGGQVTMLGAVGADEYGKILKQNLAATGVNIESVAVLPGVDTGQAYITVNEQGENSIVLISGANGEMTCEQVKKHLYLLDACDIVVLQLEIPLETVLYVKWEAIRRKKLVIIDPAPARTDIPDELWEGVSYIKPNETELNVLTGYNAQTKEEMTQAARSLVEKGVECVMVTLGSKGVLCVTEDTSDFFAANPVNAVDTTAAGDCFTGAFAVALSEGKNCTEAICFGQKASAIAVTRKGAQSSLPTRDEVDG